MAIVEKYYRMRPELNQLHVYIYIYIYTTRTKVFDYHENFHTNSIKLDLLKKEHVLKQ